MIEVLALAGAVTKIAGGISAAIKAGKDTHALLPAFGKLAKLEADINLAESGKHKGPLGRLTSREEEGFAIAQAKMALRVFDRRKLWKLKLLTETVCFIFCRLLLVLYFL